MKMPYSEIIIRVLAWTAIVTGTYFLIMEKGHADDYHVIDLNELNLDYKNFKMINDKARDPLVYPEPPKEGVDVNLDLGLVNNYGYWNSSVQSLTVDSQYRSIGLVMHLGVHLTEYLDVGYFHHSAHVLDEQQPYMPFLTEDAVEVKIFLYRNNHEHKGVF